MGFDCFSWHLNTHQKVWFFGDYLPQSFRSFIYSAKVSQGLLGPRPQLETNTHGPWTFTAQSGGAVSGEYLGVTGAEEGSAGCCSNQERDIWVGSLSLYRHLPGWIRVWSTFWAFIPSLTFSTVFLRPPLYQALCWVPGIRGVRLGLGAPRTPI